ncbi:hypothetical protein Tco_1485730 [Tanacetum coccineum]
MVTLLATLCLILRRLNLKRHDVLFDHSPPHDSDAYSTPHKSPIYQPVPGGANQIARNVIDDLIEFSGETSVDGYMSFFKSQQIAESRAFINQIREEANTVRNLVGDDRDAAQTKLQGLNELITQAEEEIKTKEAQIYAMNEWKMNWLCCLSSNMRWYDSILNILQGRNELLEKIIGCVVDSGGVLELDPKVSDIIMENEANDMDHLVNYDNDNDIDDLGYESEVYIDEEEDENNHLNGNVVKRGITGFPMFRRDMEIRWYKANVTLRCIEYVSRSSQKHCFELFRETSVRDALANDMDHLPNYDNDNDIDNLGYESKVYLDEEEQEDENNHSNGNVVKRGITRLYKFRREYGKPDGIKLSRYFDVDLTVRKLVMNRLDQLLRNFRRKLRQTYILPNQNTLSKLNEVRAKYSAILQAEEWVNFVKYTATKEYKVKSAGAKMAHSKSVYQHTMGRETEDKIKEGTLKVDHGTDAMTVVLGKEKGCYARGVSPVHINPINSIADEEGETTIYRCENNVSIQKSNGLATLEKEMLGL